MSTPDETRLQAALEQLENDDLQALILRMVRQHPDLAGLILSGEKKAVKKLRKPFNAEVYQICAKETRICRRCEMKWLRLRCSETGI